MSNMREIKTRIKSIEDTMKITNAMYLISSTKLKKAKKTLENTEPYFELLQSTIADILEHSTEIPHKYFDKRSDMPEKKKKKGYIIVTGDKGLAGAYNHNVIKLAEQEMKKPGENILFLVGQVGARAFRKMNVHIDTEFLYLAQKPSRYGSRSIAETVLEAFQEKRLDEVYIIYTKMISSVKIEPELIQLLPLKKKRFQELEKKSDIDDYIRILRYSPSPKEVLDKIVPNYVKGLIYGALVEAFAAQTYARMTAMQSATDNAKEMLQDLSLRYNRERQAAITQEITEIAGGANAL